MKKNSLILIALIGLSLCYSCTKDPDIVDEDDSTEKEASFKLNITDAKSAHAENKTIIDDSKLTKCEITIASILLKSNTGSYVSIIDDPVTANLSQLQGVIKNLADLKIPLGTYSAAKVALSRVDISYDGNNYIASVNGEPQVSISGFPNNTFGTSDGVVDAFSDGEIIFEIPLSFTLQNSDETVNVRMFFDASSSVYEIPFSYETYNWTFAGFRATANVTINLEQGIQQIKYSPPMEITPVSGSEILYYGVHTFTDFNEKGGEINSHTSQHVFRGESGDIIIDAEDMLPNSTALCGNQIAATINSEVRANETFNLTAILSNLAQKGYQLDSGKKYYFSIRKTWNITTDGKTYNLTRMCEPMPVLIP